MFDALTSAWRRFAAQPPGQRFQQRYHAARDPQSPRGATRRVIALTLGVVLILAGLVMLVIPGPGVAAMIVGLGFIAEESLILAKALDAGELRMRRSWRRIRKR